MMTINEKVTFAIVAYKYNPNLESTLKSIRSFFDGEVIVVNNNVDNALIIKVDELVNKYKSTNILYTNKLVNANVARNIAMLNCKTEYIKYVDEDDTISRDGVEKIFEKISKGNYDVVFGKTNVIPIGYLNKVKNKIYKTEVPFQKGERSTIFNDYICNYSGISLANTGSAIIRTSSLVTNNGWNEEYQRLQDRELFTRLAYNNCSFYAADAFVFDYKVNTNFKKIFMSKKLYIKLLTEYKPCFNEFTDSQKKKIYREMTFYFPFDRQYKKEIKKILWGD